MIKNTYKDTLSTSILTPVFRPVNRSHSYSYAPSLHDEIRLVTMDFGFNSCYETPSKITR